MTTLLALILSLNAHAAESKLVHCWVNIATTENGAVSGMPEKFLLEKAFEASAKELHQEDKNYEYTVSIVNGKVSLMALGEKSSGFEAINAPNKRADDLLVVTLRKKVSDKAFKAAQLQCAPNALFLKLKAAN